MPLRNRQVCLKRYPDGLPRPEDFALVESELATPEAGEVMVETHFLSMDPAPRLRMDAAARFPPPLRLNSVVVGRGVGIVRVSSDPSLPAGTVVAGELGWQEHAVVPAAQLRRVDTQLGPMQAALGLLGPSGLTAWCLVREAGRVAAGETVVVAAAAGSVGSVAVQLARLAGARVVAIVGGAAQADFVISRLSAAAAVDYRSPRLHTDLAAACPSGANVFLDSVGGDLHNSVMEHLADRARVVAFGYISTYNQAANAQTEYGRIYQLIRRRAELRGFLIADYAARFPEALAELSRYFAERKIFSFEHVADGIEQVPAAFAALFSGDPVGKQLVRVHSPVDQGSRGTP